MVPCDIGGHVMEETDRENGADRHPLEGAGREERMVGTLLL